MEYAGYKVSLAMIESVCYFTITFMLYVLVKHPWVLLDTECRCKNPSFSSVLVQVLGRCVLQVMATWLNYILQSLLLQEERTRKGFLLWWALPSARLFYITSCRAQVPAHSFLGKWREARFHSNQVEVSSMYMSQNVVQSKLLSLNVE